MCAGETSNLIHHLEAKHSVEYSKAKDNEMDKTELHLVVGPSTKKCSSAHTKEINTALLYFTVLDLCPVMVAGFNQLLNCVKPGYVVPSKTFVMNSLKQ